MSKACPTFIVVDRAGRELDRTSGLESAAELARFYKTAAAKARPPADSNAHVGSRERSPVGRRRRRRRTRIATKPASTTRRSPLESTTSPNARAGLHQSQAVGNRRPHPGHRQPLDRLRIGHGHLQHARGVADSHLCAHLQARRPQAGRAVSVPAADHDRPVRRQAPGTKPAKVHFLESVEGEAVDYDFTRDVGLIRISPGRRLPASPRRAGALGAAIAHAGPHGRLFRRDTTRRRGTRSSDGRESRTSCRATRLTRRSSATSPPSKGAPAGGCSPTTATSRASATSRSRQGNHGLYATPRIDLQPARPQQIDGALRAGQTQSG